MPATLDEIGLKWGTDKASTHHGYLPFYETFLAPLRDQQLTILEVGVYRGASLRTWEEYFPNAKVVGADIQVTCKRFEGGRVRVELVDQSNVEDLAQLAIKHGPFDLIIEDGSHMWEHQITTLRSLFPFLRSGGHYIVEDLQTNYGALQAKYRGVASQSCMDFLKRWADMAVADDLIDPQSVEDAFLRTYGRSIEFMSFHRRSCVLKKHTPATKWPVSVSAPLAETPVDALPVFITAHVGMRGDIFGPFGYVDEGGDAFTFQGFALASDLGGLEYRMRFPDGAWSDWTPEGGFVGTRGKAIAATGFSVRLVEPLRDRFALDLYGLFVGGAKAKVGAGEDCVAALEEPLRGMQIVLRPASRDTAVAAERPQPEPAAS